MRNPAPCESSASGLTKGLGDYLVVTEILGANSDNIYVPLDGEDAACDLESRCQATWASFGTTSDGETWAFEVKTLRVIEV